MIIENHKIDLPESEAFFTLYRLDNSRELHPDKMRPLVIIAPGGGYLFTSDREAEPIAMSFLSLGYHAVVLRYTTGDREGKKIGVGKEALRELAYTLCCLRHHAKEWYIHKDKIALCGFSAGAHLAAELGVHWHEEELIRSVSSCGSVSDDIKPNALILGYGLLNYQVMKDKTSKILKEGTSWSENKISFMETANLALTGSRELTEEVIQTYSPCRYVSEKTPPVFLWHTSKDNLVFAENSLTFALELAKHNVPYELHIFQDGEHGLALANEVTANSQNQINLAGETWFHLASLWLKSWLPF